jgi:hypothetical protein
VGFLCSELGKYMWAYHPATINHYGQWFWVAKMGAVYYSKTWRYDVGLAKTQEQLVKFKTYICQIHPQIFCLYSVWELCTFLTSQRRKQIQIVTLCLPIFITTATKGDGRGACCSGFTAYFLVLISQSGPFNIYCFKFLSCSIYLSCFN